MTSVACEQRIQAEMQVAEEMGFHDAIGQPQVGPPRSLAPSTLDGRRPARPLGPDALPSGGVDVAARRKHRLEEGHLVRPARGGCRDGARPIKEQTGLGRGAAGRACSGVNSNSLRSRAFSARSRASSASSDSALVTVTIPSRSGERRAEAHGRHGDASSSCAQDVSTPHDELRSFVEPGADGQVAASEWSLTLRARTCAAWPHSCPLDGTVGSRRPVASDDVMIGFCVTN